MVRSKGFGTRLAEALLVMLVLLVTVLSVAPIINTLAISLSAQSKAAAGLVRFWPVDFTLASYQRILNDNAFLRAFFTSTVRVVLGGGLNILLTIIMAFALSREKEKFRARNVYMWLIVFTMLFNGGLIPWYMTIKSLHLLDSIWAMILPGAVPVFNVILLMNFFRSVPKELEEAAFMDGAGPWKTMFSVYVPVSMPAIATITLFSIINHWNSFFDGLILMNNPKNWPLQTLIQQMVVKVDYQSIKDPAQLVRLMEVSGQTFNAAKIFVSMIPILVIYPLLQRNFVSGIVLGSVKE